MRKNTSRLGIALLFGVSISSCTPSVEESVDESFISACENVYKKRLRSPSTYERVEVGIHRHRFLRFENGVGVPIENPNLDPPSQGYRLAYIQYDAANAYGAPIRGGFWCEGDWHEASGGLLDEGDLLINGETYLESLAP